MDNLLLVVIILLIVIVGISIALRRREVHTAADASGNANADAIRTKADHLARSLSLARTRGTVTNNDIEQLLGVSDATAERYLNELEKEGKLVQVGKTGRDVRYKFIG